MKKMLLILIAILVVISFTTSCSTTETTSRATMFPYAASVSFPAADTYKVLGRVDYLASVGQSGYLSFLEYAKSVYPSTDDIVNILVDSEQIIEKTTISTFFFGSQSTSQTTSTYKMTGIAIEYLD